MRKIVTIYDERKKNLELTDMSYIRWVKISEALARCGHKVDIATNEFLKEESNNLIRPVTMGRNLRRVPLSEINFKDYDVVKTLFHSGFNVLEKYGGLDHKFIIAKLGSVVGPVDMDGIYFYGDMRKDLYQIQSKIDKYAKYVTVLSKPAKHLWQECFGKKNNLLLVPGGVESIIPDCKADPYPTEYSKRCIFAGNIYDSSSQPEANATLISKLNKIGYLLSQMDIRLYLLGPGDVQHLDQRFSTYLGAASYEHTWQYLFHANVGLVVSAGEFMHNNESTKIYHYIRAGLPVVSEEGFPNDNVIKESKLGFVVESNNMELMSDKINEAINIKWNRKASTNYILENHSWDKRVQVYDKLIKGKFSKQEIKTKKNKIKSNIPDFVFICGSAGSGNTIMFECITKDPNVYGINEDNFGLLISRLLKSEIDMGKCPHSIDSYIRFLYELKADRRTLILKSPSNVRYMRIIRKYLPNSKFIIMIREPHAAIISGTSNTRLGRDISTVSKYWKGDYNIYVDPEFNDIVVVHFDEFLTNPVKCFVKISKIILPLSKSVYEFATKSINADIANPNRWKEKIDEEQARELELNIEKLRLNELFNNIINNDI